MYLCVSGKYPDIMKKYLLILLVFCCYKDCFGQLTLEGIKCGTKICGAYEYCSQFHNACEKCAKICNPKDNNVEVKICERDCQDYLLDVRYGKLGGKGTADPVNDGNENLKGDVQKLYSLVIVTLTLTCLAIIVISAIVIIQSYKYVKKHDITWGAIKNYFSNSDDTSNKAPNGNTTASGKPDLRLNITSPESQTGLHTPATMTTSISRRPAEDSTLDYAYDNPAMSAGTPSPHSVKPPPRGSHF